MSATDSAMPRYMKIAAKVEKYENHRTPADGLPDEVVESVEWIEIATGETVTDPEVIDALEGRIAHG